MTARLNHKIKPLDRGERYESPLEEAIGNRGYGTNDGGGTLQSPEGEILWIDVHMYLSTLDESIPFVIHFLEQRGAPKGSKIIVYDDEHEVSNEIPFGVREGFALYLNGTGLPDAVYHECDIDVVVAEIDNRLAGHGQTEAHWHGPTETALYIYGDSNRTMKSLIHDFLDSYPLCQGARVVDLTP